MATTRSSRATTCSACGPMRHSIIDYSGLRPYLHRECEERTWRRMSSKHCSIPATRSWITASTAIAVRRSFRWQRKKQRQIGARGLRATPGQRPLAHSAQTRKRKADESRTRFPSEPQENLLYFFEKHAPLLEPWEREIVRIVRKIALYFYPQRQTKIMNEGWATFWHYNLLYELYDEGLLTEGNMLEFLQSHTNVVYQPEFDSPYYSGINPYTLGFAMFSDIRRMCENPTEEDKRFVSRSGG